MGERDGGQSLQRGAQPQHGAYPQCEFKTRGDRAQIFVRSWSALSKERTSHPRLSRYRPAKIPCDHFCAWLFLASS